MFTTVNVQHLEGLNDKIAAITHVSVAERIPDRIFDQAASVELVDIEPDDLIERLEDRKDITFPIAPARRSATSSPGRTWRRCARSRCAAWPIG